MMVKTTEDVQIRANMLAEKLIGTTDKMEDHIEALGWSSADDDMIMAVRILVSRCSKCDTWVETSDLDDEGRCESCWTEDN